MLKPYPKCLRLNISPFSFFGPTCDALDYMKGPFELPEDVEEGDYIDPAVVRGNLVRVTQTDHSFTAGQAVQRTSGSYVLSQADTLAHAEVTGVVQEVVDGNNFILATPGLITGLSGLTDAAVYFLSEATPGLLTVTEPNSNFYYSKPVMQAISTTSAIILNMRGIHQTTGNSGGNLQTIYQSSHSLTVGQVLKRLGNPDDKYALACADTPENAEVAGIVQLVVDGNHFVLATPGFAMDLPTMVDGTVYFLSASTPGAITTTEPDTSLYVSKPVLLAVGTTTGLILNTRGATLAGVPSNNDIIPLSVDGGGLVIASNQIGWVRVPYDCRILQWTIMAQPAGSSIVFDIWKLPYANFPPTVTNSIVASDKPTLVSGITARGSALTDWDTAIHADDVLMFHIDSASVATKVTCDLQTVKIG